MEDFRIHEFPKNQYGREIYLSTAILWDCRISVPRFSLKKKKKKLQKNKNPKGKYRKASGQMTIHRNASRTNNHLGYTNGTYLQYLKSDSNLIRCRKKCTERNHQRDLLKVKIRGGHPLRFWSGDPKSICFIRTTGACCRWSSEQIVKRHQLVPGASVPTFSSCSPSLLLLP